MSCRPWQLHDMRGLILGLACCAGVASAQERPALRPTVDVDVTYRSALGPRVLEQRMRWSARDGVLRVDPPTQGLWMVIDLRAHRMWAVQDAARTVVEEATPAATDPLAAQSGAAFARQGSAVIAGVKCTEWATTDITGAATLACLTDDGVLLRAIAGGRTLTEASSVRYGALDASIFRIPADYRNITPPPR